MVACTRREDATEDHDTQFCVFAWLPPMKWRKTLRVRCARNALKLAVRTPTGAYDSASKFRRRLYRHYRASSRLPRRRVLLWEHKVRIDFIERARNSRYIHTVLHTLCCCILAAARRNVIAPCPILARTRSRDPPETANGLGASQTVRTRSNATMR